jgi:hypothetical protein
LVRRGITPEERQRPAALVEAVQGGGVTIEARIDDSRAAQEQGLMKLYAWYSDWAETARAVVRRRDQLIRLGLAKRRPNTDEGAASGEEPGPGIEPVD